LLVGEELADALADATIDTESTGGGDGLIISRPGEVGNRQRQRRRIPDDERRDAIMLERMIAAKKQPGWVGGQLLRSRNGRMIIGTWQRRADWERWHHAREFAETCRQLDRMTGWHEVVAEVRKGRAVKSKSRATRRSRH
jgi:heme-degrading monooxygenase HmoA